MIRRKPVNSVNPVSSDARSGGLCGLRSFLMWMWGFGVAVRIWSWRFSESSSAAFWLWGREWGWGYGVFASKAKTSSSKVTSNNRDYLEKSRRLVVCIEEKVAVEQDVSEDGLVEVNSDGSESRAQWDTSQDAQLTHCIGKSREISGVFSAQLVRHLDHKERYSKNAAERLPN